MNESQAQTARVGVVLNPSKFDDPQPFRDEVAEHLFMLGVKEEPRFYDTTVEDPGYGQARQAVADGCTTVIAAGGDGTVRLVAAGVAGSDAAMGIIPMGTGNLFARNLEIPVHSVEDAVKLAVLGTVQHTDVGWLGFGENEEEARSAELEPFLVIAGFGFDAVVMETTDSRLKKYVGWLAYAVAGARHIVGRGQPIRLTLDGRTIRPHRARTVMIGNVGRLPGGITLMPGADSTNGSLELLTLDWKGAVGFSQIASEMVLPGSPRSLARISNKRTFQAREALISTHKSLPTQLDGDYVGLAKVLYAKVQPHALKIRTGTDIQI